MRKMIGFVVLRVCLAMALLAALPGWADAPGRPVDHTVIAAVLKDFPPLYQTSTDGQPEGFAIDILRDVGERTRLRVVHLPVEGWDEALRAVREGRADLIPGIGFSQVRESEFLFSTPIETVPVNWFVRHDSTQFRHPDDLAGRAVGVLAESAAASRLKARATYRVMPYDSLEHALFALLSGTVDGLAIPGPVLWRKAHAIGIGDRIRSIGEPLMELKRGFLYRADHAALRDFLDPYLQAHVASPAYQAQYLTWYGTPTPGWSGQRVFWIMLGLLAVVLFLMLAWRTVSVQRLNTRLRESEARHRAYVENAPLGIFVADGQGRYIDVNPSACRMVGYAREALLTMSITDLAPPGELEMAIHQFHNVRRLGALELDLILRRKDGQHINVHLRAIVLPGDRVMGLCQDVTEQKRAEAALRASESRFRAIFEGLTNVAVQGYDMDRKVVYWNHASELIYGYRADEVVGRYLEDLIIPSEMRAAVVNNVSAWARGGPPIPPGELTLRRKDGTPVTVFSSHVMLPDASGKPEMYCVDVDLTELKQAESRLKLAASVFTHAREGIMITDASGRIVDVNETFTRITGYSRDEAVGALPALLKSDRQGPEFYAEMWRELRDKGHWYGELWNRRKSGEIYPELLTISAVRDVSGRIQYYVGLFSDISAQKAQQRQLEHVAHFDALTSLPNRVLLGDRLHQAMSQARRRGQRVVVAYIDLDGFKAVNDHHGHEVGDQLLSALAERMRLTLREGDTLARLGGDEFIAVLIDLPDIRTADPLIQRLLTAAAQTTRIGGLDLKVSGSIGVTLYPQAEEVDADQLLRQADQAMYQAKLAGKNRFHVFDAEHDRHLRGHHESLERIRRALAEDELVLHYQPKVNLRDGRVIGVEALVRWQHPERGLLPPAAFLPEIEDHPHDIELGEWVIEAALAQSARWRAAGLALPISVNVSAHHLQLPDFVERLKRRLALHPELPPGALELEVLESSALEDVEHVSQVIEHCARIGVAFALDDFGTGYSSLTYLKRLPASTLKIDQSFVRDMLDDPEDLAILEGVLGLAGAFRRQAIAEGVETVQHGRMLLQLGCQLAQGFGIARPMPAEQLPDWMAGWRPDPAWSGTRQVDAEARAVLYAGVEHRAWVKAIEQYVAGLRAVPPNLDRHDCRFGVWLDASQATQAPAQDARFQMLMPLHDRVHEVAAEVLVDFARGGRGQALARLSELRRVRDDLLNCLSGLLDRN
ncbi:MAG: EAL domain-containing protein [Pseudomonadota bacterium]